MIKKNKVGKYLLYAIGEIFLVVIGILIALQVNNKNEEKNNIAQAEKHLETIRLNLTDDIFLAEYVLQATEHCLKYSNTFLDQFKTLTPLDNNVQKYLVFLTYEHNLEINKSGYSSLLNSNGMSYISESLRIKLLDYYGYIEQLKSREENANSEIRTSYNPYVNENYHWIYNKTNSFFKQADFYKDDPRNLKNIDIGSVILDKQLEVLVYRRRSQSFSLSKFYSKTIRRAKEIISEIENNKG